MLSRLMSYFSFLLTPKHLRPKSQAWPLQTVFVLVSLCSPGPSDWPKVVLGVSFHGAPGEHLSSSVSYGRKERKSSTGPGDMKTELRPL